MGGNTERHLTALRSASAELSPLERNRLLNLEQVVEQGLDAFVAVGQALLEIRDARLYRETHGSFEAYLDERWGVSRSRGYQLIDAARVTKALSTDVDLEPPANEAQARSLVPLAGDEQAMVEVWRDLRVEHGGRVTADLVRQAVSERVAREAFCREPIAASEPALPETPPDVSPPSKAGGLYEIGEHRLLCGDATSAADASRLMSGERAALLFTSPPYLDVRLFGEGQDLSLEYLAKFLPVFAEHAELIVVNLGLVRRGNAVVRYWDTYIEAAEKAGLHFLAWNIWDKGPSGAQPRGHGDFFPPQHEWLLVFGKEPKPLFRTIPNESAGKLATTTRRQADGTLRTSKPLMTLPSRPIGSVLTLPGERKETHRWDHSAVFPVELPKAYIEALTEPGDIVIDPFAGAGSTLVACELTGRRCFALELEPKYCDLIRSRYAALIGADGRAER
jgi:DNA modification methylase